MSGKYGKNRKGADEEKSPHSPHSHTFHPAHSSEPQPDPIPPRGDPRTLLSYQKAEVIYDLTYRFAHRYLARGDRTIDQMIQAARSGKANIVEGSKAGRTSKEMELKLTNVARASLEELLDDYRDFLRARDFLLWEKDSREVRYVRELGRKTPQSFEVYRQFFETRPPETLANIAICLIHQAHYLLDRQLGRLELDFLKHGGLRERMTRARSLTVLARHETPRHPPQISPPRRCHRSRRQPCSFRSQSRRDASRRARAQIHASELHRVAD